MTTQTVYYWPTETPEAITDDIHSREARGWYVHQTAPVTFGGVDEPASLFVVYTNGITENCKHTISTIQGGWTGCTICGMTTDSIYAVERN